MATQRAKAQTPTTAKLAASHAAAHKLRHQLLDLRSCPPPSRRYPLFSVHPSNSNTKLPSSNRCVAQTLTVEQVPQRPQHALRHLWAEVAELGFSLCWRLAVSGDHGTPTDVFHSLLGFLHSASSTPMTTPLSSASGSRSISPSVVRS